MSGLWVPEERNSAGSPFRTSGSRKVVISGPVRYILLWGAAVKFFFSGCCASQGRCLLHTWWMSNMSGLWVPERKRTGAHLGPLGAEKL